MGKAQDFAPYLLCKEFLICRAIHGVCAFMSVDTD